MSNYKHFINQVSSHWLHNVRDRPLRILETCQGEGESTEIYRQVGCVVSFEKDREKYLALKEKFRDAFSIEKALTQYDLSEVAANFRSSSGYPVLMPPNAEDSIDMIPSLKAHDCIFDIVDVDPYGSPRPFIQQVFDLLDNGSILLITSGEMHYARYQPTKAMSSYDIEANETLRSTQKMFKKDNVLILGSTIIQLGLDRQIGLYTYFIHDYYNGSSGVQRIGFLVRKKINIKQKSKIREQMILDPILGTKIIASDFLAENTTDSLIAWRFKPDVSLDEIEKNLKRKLEYLDKN